MVLYYLSLMYLLRILQKVLFICNLCWVGDLILRVMPVDEGNVPPQAGVVLDFFRKSMLVLGELVALPLGIILNVVIIGLWAGGKVSIDQLPKVWYVCNLLFIPVIILFHLL